MPWHVRVFGVCLAGVGQTHLEAWERLRLHREDQLRLETKQPSSTAPMGMLKGRTMMQSRAGDGEGQAQPRSHSSALWWRQRTAFLSPIICRKAGLEQSWLRDAEKCGEIQESWNKLWQELSLLFNVSAALGFIPLPLQKLEGRDSHLPTVTHHLLFGDGCCSFLAVVTVAEFCSQAECNRAGLMLICCSSNLCSSAGSWKQRIFLTALALSEHKSVHTIYINKSFSAA